MDYPTNTADPGSPCSTTGVDTGVENFARVNAALQEALDGDCGWMAEKLQKMVEAILPTATSGEWVGDLDAQTGFAPTFPLVETRPMYRLSYKELQKLNPAELAAYAREISRKGRR